MIIFDMDGVITRIKNSWEYLHEYFTPGFDRSYSKILLKRYLKGEISYPRWIAEEIKMLIERRGRGIRKEEIYEAYSKVEIYEEIIELINIARRSSLNNFAIVSGGVSILARRVGEILGIREVYANHLIFDQRRYLVPGGIPLVEPLSKDRVIGNILSKLGIDNRETIFIGDSIWDLPGFRVVGYPIALNCVECKKDEEEADLVHVTSHRELVFLVYKLLKNSS